MLFHFLGELMNIQDKVAVITGGASGLGLATAKLLAEKGAKLMLLDLNEDNAKAAVKDLGESSD
jgi:NAD(P)-dependent dehydrogenase (short-subunit alcohol dehydrogenase family)